MERRKSEAKAFHNNFESANYLPSSYHLVPIRIGNLLLLVFLETGFYEKSIRINEIFG